jgi:hypothetical protein
MNLAGIIRLKDFQTTDVSWRTSGWTALKYFLSGLTFEGASETFSQRVIPESGGWAARN